MPPQLIIALDLPSSQNLGALLQSLPSEITWFKIGLELFTAEGPRALEPLRAQDKKIFLDLKLHDIPHTVERAVAAAARHGIGMLTLHAAGGRAMLQAAAQAARSCHGQAPKLIAVTTLTSLNQADLAEVGISRELKDQALALGELALAAGLDGLVASAQEVEHLRRHFGQGPLLVTPGIRPSCAQGATEGRPAGNTAGDQKRVATPTLAVRAGSNFLVVGRPILEAADPRAAALAILNEIRDASGPE
ncbi:MAG: orotidine-5'-phosphate decarboxylase [Verrucomicrobia bacterium]|nr:orotidine-5'-phosphate decarboxylase [Verrucomicrobiota bacterium]MBU1734728.1 orotidine-5'-phosphate decarboxylase [Verrucomicrobiota bacterium]